MWDEQVKKTLTKEFQPPKSHRDSLQNSLLAREPMTVNLKEPSVQGTKTSSPASSARYTNFEAEMTLELYRSYYVATALSNQN